MDFAKSKNAIEHRVYGCHSHAYTHLLASNTACPGAKSLRTEVSETLSSLSQIVYLSTLGRYVCRNVQSQLYNKRQRAVVKYVMDSQRIKVYAWDLHRHAVAQRHARGALVVCLVT